MTKEEKTFLDLLSFTEGTFGVSNNGYDVLLNDGKEKGYSRVMKGWTETNAPEHKGKEWYVKSLDSTAAGRYQFIFGTWVSLNGDINAPMTKVNQDAAALKYLKKIFGSSYDFKINSVSDMDFARGKLIKIWTSWGTKSSAELYELYKTILAKYS